MCPLLVDNCNDFAIDLYSKLAGRTTGNLFVSPSSVVVRISDDNGGSERRDSSRNGERCDSRCLQTESIERSASCAPTRETGGLDFRVANRLWGQSGYHFLNDFLQTTEQCYGASLETVDFRTAAENSSLSNQRLGRRTDCRKITDLIPPGTLDEMTRLVITNAITFWETGKMSSTQRIPRNRISGSPPMKAVPLT